MLYETDELGLLEYFQYLDELQESGITNMYGAAVHLAKRYGMSKEVARDLLKVWMETYDEMSDIEDRVDVALELLDDE